MAESAFCNEQAASDEPSSWLDRLRALDFGSAFASGPALGAAGDVLFGVVVPRAGAGRNVDVPCAAIRA